MAFRKAKEKTIHARALTKPQPRFVSIVSAGANQTPIKTVKVDIVATKEIHMTQIAALKAEGHEVQKIELRKGDTFPDEAVVRAFLDEGGYTFTDLSETDDGFVVENKSDEFTDDVRRIEVDEDLVVHVGKLAVPEQSEEDPDDAAKAQANKAGSAITKVEPIEVKKGGDAGSTLRAGADGKVTSVRKRQRGTAPLQKNSIGLMYPKDDPVDGGDDGLVEEVTDDDGGSQEVTDDAEKALEEDANCGIDEVFVNGKCVPSVVKVAGETFDLIWDKEVAKEMMVPLGSFVIPAEKVDIVDGSCGNAHVAITVDGVLVCVPTGDRTPIINDTEVTPSNPAGGQGNAGFGGVSPAAGQTNRSRSMSELLDHTKLDIDTKEIAERFDEFSAHFSDGKTLGEVMDDANDGFPPGLEQVIFAAVMAMRNNFLSGDMAAVKQAGTDLGEVAAMLGGMFGETAERGPAVMRGWVDQLSGQFESIGWPEPSEFATKDQEDKDNPKDSAMVDALSGIASTMKSIADQLGEVSTEVTATKAATADLTDRIKVVEDRRQTRKGAAEGDANDGSTVKPKVSPIGKLTMRNQLGITT